MIIMAVLFPDSSNASEVRGLRVAGGSAPTAGEMLWHGAALGAVYEVVFYYSHRLLHAPRFYTRFHKKHHQTFASVAISAHYATPLDFWLVQSGPVILGALLFDTHVATYVSLSSLSSGVFALHGGRDQYGAALTVSVTCVTHPMPAGCGWSGWSGHGTGSIRTRGSTCR